MKQTNLNTKYESLLQEFNDALTKLQWSTRNFFDEYYNTSIDYGGGILTQDEIKQKYDAFRQAKYRKKINIHALEEYVKYIQNHYDFKKSKYIYANYISLNNLEPSTEKALKKLSSSFTKEQID